MITLRVSVLLVFAAALTAAEPPAPALNVSAARTKPGNPWRDYPTRLVSSLPNYQSTTDGELSPYGGLKSEPRPATGFFHAEKIGGRWWLIDPAGCRFIHVGVVAVAFPSLSPDQRKTAGEKLATPASWAEATTEFLHEHRFNGTGAWSDTELLRAANHPVAYTKISNFMSAYGTKRGGIYQKSGHMGYPGDCIFVFDPAFVPFCDDYAKRLAATKDDPWLVGHFSDNELPLYTKTLDNFLKLAPEDPGRQAADRWLADRRAAHPAERRHLLDVAVYGDGGWRTEPFVIDGPETPLAAGELRVRNVAFLCAPTMRNWMDGFANTTGAGWVVKTQADRGKFYQNFTLGLLESGGCVGWHWFKYRDNDPNNKKADPSNLDSNKGVVTLGLEPYVPLVQAMQELNRQVYSLAAYFDSRRAP
ncbi:MAG: hypothetical protein NTV51_11985 [Verrucomicrobia bacterium]|nr:hypothetical protein [Verrucomicrobiota bacterium]